MRDTEAELVEVGRPAVDGDNVTIDLRGTGGDGEEVVNLEDFIYEVGSGRVAPELDVELRGAKVGDILAFTATRPGSPEVAFRVLVKDVKEKRLPDLTDEWAAESSEFSTVAELREDLGPAHRHGQGTAGPLRQAGERPDRAGRTGRRRPRCPTSWSKRRSANGCTT